ncbi:MAG: FFLEELY motif protein [Rudaea sp.]
MTDRIPRLDKLLHQFTHGEDARRQTVTSAPLDPRLALLRRWQSARLAQTYSDLLAKPSFAPACRFFLSDIYAPRDFSQRDHDAERVHAFLSRLMPPATIQILTELIELNRLTTSLDRSLADVLVERLGMADSLTEEMYGRGYRLCNNFAERAQQIALFEKLLNQVGEIAQLRATGIVLAVASKPVRTAGWADLYDFVATGYAAFKPMRDYRQFSSTVARRERQILARLFDGTPDPFAVP